MTENQWSKDGSVTAPPAMYTTTDPYAPNAPVTEVPMTETVPAPDQSTPSMTDTARSEAGHVADQAAGSGQQVAQTARAEAANVAGEVKANAKDLLYQAKADLTDQAGTQQQKVAQGLRSISSELHSMAAASDQPGVATDLVRRAAERSYSVASWLDQRDPGSLLDEVKSFARQRPGTFLLMAAGAGILAGRLSRSLSAGAPDARVSASHQGTGSGTAAPVTRVPGAGTAVPPPPVQLPGPDTTTAGMASSRDPRLDDPALAGRSAADTYPPNRLPAEGTRQDGWADDPMAGDHVSESPLSGERMEDDPNRDDHFSGGRR
jgi:hypothetical protein